MLPNDVMTCSHQSTYDIAAASGGATVFGGIRADVGRSTGAHGLRHSYARNRMRRAATQGMLEIGALETVSPGDGPFSARDNGTYLRWTGADRGLLIGLYYCWLGIWTACSTTRPPGH